MHAYWDKYPWVLEIQAELRSARRLCTYLVQVYRNADQAGQEPCYKCGSCLRHRLWQIRAKYDPEVADLAP